MPSQTLIFTAIPNGINSKNKKLKVSLFLAPRLDGAQSLSDFKDFLDWPGRIHTHGLKFTLACAGNTHTVAADRNILRPDIWQSIFEPKAYVEKVPVSQFNNNLIVSYPTRECLGYLRNIYQTIAAGRGNQDVRSPLVPLLEPLVFRDGLKSTLFSETSQMRVTMWQEQHPPGAIATPKITATPASLHDMATRFALFHHFLQAHNRPHLPLVPFDKLLDFHKALTALSSYPALLRALGLVFDFEVPASLCPTSPAGGKYGTIAVQEVDAGFSWTLKPTFGFPATSYLHNPDAFRAAPATAPTAVRSKKFEAGDVVAGFLAIGTNDYELVELDIDGAMLKALTLADNVFNPLTTPESVAVELPSLRSAGIALMASGRGAQLLQSIQNNNAFNQALAGNTAFPRPFTARDLVRGFRIDVYVQRTGKWYSLHRRDGTYKFGAHAGIVLHSSDEEGFLQPAAAMPAEDKTRKPNKIAKENDIPQPSTDIYFHERISRWDGWSLSAPRPVRVPLNRSPDPGKATEADPTMNQPVTPFKMVTQYAAHRGSLPELRFGDQYRLRARAVDIAGNSVALDSGTPLWAALPSDGSLMPYLRFEPVNPPLVVLQNPVSKGGSLERLVIRTYNSDPSLDNVPTKEQDARHIAPPKTSVRMAEQHGMLDDAAGHLRGADIFNFIVQRDKFNTPKKDSNPQLEVGYFPDPLCRGAAIRNLPQTEGDTYGRVSNNELHYRLLSDVQPTPGSVTFLGFGTNWPDLRSFRLVMRDSSAPPTWDSTNRVLTISQPKSAVTEVALSSYMNPPDLSLMGVWAWIRELYESVELESMANASASYEVGATSDALALLTRLALEGGHEMLTPSRTLTLVHAVQQPIGRPTFFQLPAVHRLSKPILASKLANSFTPITAWRTPGSHTAVLLGGLQINAASTAKIDIEASWIEVTDDTTRPEPTSEWNNGPVETIHLNTPQAGPIYANALNTRMVAVYIPKTDVLWFSAPFDRLEGVATPAEVAAPVHNFHDTKHRWVTYKAVASSRFQEYFKPNLNFKRTGELLVVDVPSSSRPVTPDIAYVVPTFGWEEQETTNIKSSIRFGNSVRVYLNRPWYSSGQDELLGVVLWPASLADPDYATREAYKPYFTQWGGDPIWQTGALAPVPAIGDFPAAVATDTKLTLEETEHKFDVAGHNVHFDAKRKLWFCDIEFENLLSYAPFVRLALARYQTHSITGQELSRVSLADFVQLTPQRSAVVSINPLIPSQARIFIGGLAPQGPNTSLISVTAQQKLSKVETDMGWQPADPAQVTITEDIPPPQQPGSALWSGTIKFMATPPPGKFRIVVHEYERIPYLDDTGVEQGLGLRLVYAAIVPYNFPVVVPK